MRATGLYTARYRRATLLYIVAIVGPSLLLLWLGVASVRRQKASYAAIRESNLRLVLQRSAERVVRDSVHLATLALRDAQPWAPLAIGERAADPARQRDLRAHLARVAARHPVVAQYFLMHEGGVLFPLALSPLPLTRDDLMADVPRAHRPRVSAAFTRAEALEAMAPLRAAAAYLECGELPAPPRVRAHAVLRAARAARLGGDVSAARKLLRQLQHQYGDEYDLFHRPYALVAALELGEASLLDTARLAADLRIGRWELAYDQAVFFLARLGAPLRERSPGRFAPFLQGLERARILDRERRSLVTAASKDPTAFHLDGPPEVGGVYVLAAPEVRRGLVAGVVLDVDWIARHAVQRVSQEMGGQLHLRLDTAKNAPQNDAPSTTKLDGPLAGYVLRIDSTYAATDSREAGEWLVAAATLGVCGILLLGVALLVRDASRDSHLARLRNDFVSGVSHQLRTPLTLIRLYGEMLADDDGLSAEDRRGHVRVITSESQRLTTLVERVLEFSRVERGRKPYDLRPSRLDHAIRPVIDAYAPYLRQQGFTVDIDVHSDLPVLQLDVSAVADGLTNLLDNACKYCEAAKYVALRVRSGPGVVVLEVEDHGPGIPPTDVERIFEAFARGSTHPEKGGYGLGLYLVREMMQAHGGTAQVSTRPGQGSCFRLTFPT